jgi:hypothetical protein
LNDAPPTVLRASRVKNGKFTVAGAPAVEFDWIVHARRGSIVVEPSKDRVMMNGSGPYRWLA